MPTKQARFWCWTLNNPTDEEKEYLIGITTGENKDDYIKYIVFQLEEGTETHTPHLQGYVEVSPKRTKRQMKTILHTNRVHLEVRKGSAKQASDYCEKEDSGEHTTPEGVRIEPGRRLEGPWKWGEISKGPGQRNDLAAVKRRIDEGATQQEIADEFFKEYIRYGKAFEQYRLLKVPKRFQKSNTTIIIGPPRTGKTRYVWETEGTDNVYAVPPGGQWFDMYAQEPVVLLDDFYGNMQWSLLLQLLDRYPLLVPFKGGFTKFTSKKVYITSNSHPSTWYTSNKIDKTALYERIEAFIYMGKDGLKYETDSYDNFTEFYYRLHPIDQIADNFNPGLNV